MELSGSKKSTGNRKAEGGLKQPLMRRNSRENNPKIDVVSIVSKQQQSRVTTINLNTYQPFPERGGLRGLQLANREPSSREQDQDEVVGQGNMVRLNSVYSQQQSFIGTYNNNGVIGIIIYLLFILFVSVEILTTSFVIAWQSAGPSQFAGEKALMTILLSETLYYCLVRYFNTVSTKKFIKQKSAVNSLKKIFNDQNSYREANPDQFKKTYLVLAGIVSCLTIAEVLYCIILTDSRCLFSQSQGYLVSSVFWGNVALPFLFEHFYLGEIRFHHDRTLRLKIFPYLVLGFALATLLEGPLLMTMMVLKLMAVYGYSPKGYDMFHLRQLIKIALLVGVVFYMVVKAKVTSVSLISWDLVDSGWSVIGSSVMVTAAMLVSRLLALIFIKQQLSKYFYTEMHIELGFVMASMLMAFTYTGMAIPTTLPQIQGFISVIFLGLIAILVYQEGNQRLQVSMDNNQSPDEHL